MATLPGVRRVHGRMVAPVIAGQNPAPPSFHRGAIRPDSGAVAPNSAPLPAAQSGSAARTVRLIGPNNGAGLTRDREIISAAFVRAGWSLIVADHRDKRPMSAVDVNVHVECVTPHLFGSARQNVIIPNPEWWVDAWTYALAHPSVVVWTKTQDAGRIFGQFRARVESLGFCSVDRMSAEVPRKRTFLHIAGASPNKGTAALLSAWREGWPHLTVIARQPDLRCRLRNVTLLNRYLPDAEIRRLQNECAFHVYPSRYEGFGHAQWEGLSCGAVVFATDGPPFDEYPEAFRLLASVPGAKVGPVVHHDVVPVAIKSAAEWAMSIGDDELAAQSPRSRQAWTARSHAFAGSVHRAIAALDGESAAARVLASVPPLVYVGRVNCVTGQGAAARHQVHVLRKHGARFAIVDAGSCASPDPDGADAFVQSARSSDVAMDAVQGTIIHIQPNIAEPFHRKSIYPRPHILVSVWETTRLPASWVPLINGYDQAWCATEWQRDVYRASGVRADLLRVVPFAVDPALYDSRPCTGGDRPFVFGAVFQWTERKDPRGLILAFLRAFTAADDVVLALKSYEGDDPATSVSERVASIVALSGMKSPPRIEVVSGAIADAGMREFYRSVDCYVSAHRGEGFGLGIAESLLSGTPVIATGWSAPAEYADGLFRPVKHRLIPPHGMDWQPFYTTDQRWAQVDVDDMAQAMRDAFDGEVEYSAARVRERFDRLVASAASGALGALSDLFSIARPQR